MENIEQQLISSRKIREFLKHFSQTQWNRVVKASVIMGIQELERSNKIQNLSCQDLEDLVVSNEAQLRSEQPSVANESHQNTAKGVISMPTKADQQQQHQHLQYMLQGKHDGQQQKFLGRERTNSLPNFSQQHQIMRRGGRPTQGSHTHLAQQDSARVADLRPGTSGGTSTAFSKPHFIQGLTATVTSRQKAGAIVGSNGNDEDTTINDSIAADLATFGDQQICYNASTVPVMPVNQPQRARSVPRNLDRLDFQRQETKESTQVLHHALPQPKEFLREHDQPQLTDRARKPQSNWRQKREPNFSKIGDKAHEQRMRSEQARIGNRPEAGRRSHVDGSKQQGNHLLQQDARRYRNLLPAQMSVNGQRAQSLNRLIYPSWWGDAEQDLPKKAKKAHSPDGSKKQPLAGRQDEPIMTEQPRTRNLMYNAEAYINTCTTEQTIEHQQQFQQVPQQYTGHLSDMQNYNGHPGAHGHAGRTQGTFQMAAQRQQTETSMTHNSSTMSLADALQQAKATADRLQRDIDKSKRQRANLMGKNAGQPSQQPCYAHEHQPTVSANHENPMIVDIRNEDAIRRQKALQAKQQKQASRNSSSNRELHSRRSNMRSAGAINQENYQRNGSRQQVQRFQSGSGSNVVLQHSPPRTTKTQLARQQYNSQLARQRAINQNKNTQSGPLPGYLKSVTSKIKDQIQQAKHFGQNTHSQNVPVEIYVAPPPHPHQQPQQQANVRNKRSHRGEGQANKHNRHAPNADQDLYEDQKYGNQVKLKYQNSDMNQHYANTQHHGHQQYQHNQPHYNNYQPQNAQQLHHQQYSVQDPAIINHNSNKQRHMGDVCQDLLDSPYIQKFAEQAEDINYDNQQHHGGGHEDDQNFDGSSFDDTQNQQQPIHHQHHHHHHQHHQQQQHYGQEQTTISQDTSSKQDDSTIQTHHLNAMSNGAPLSQGGNQPHLFSVENSSSMVMYNATVRNQYTNTKTDTSAANTQHTNEQNNMRSHGNQILFDSKAFDVMPSQLHQINSQTGALSGAGAPSSHNNLTTLNNQPFSVENPTISASSTGQSNQEFQHQHSQNDYGNAFRSAGFGGGHQEHQQMQSQQRSSDYEAGSEDYHQQQQYANQKQPSQQSKQRPVSAYNRNQQVSDGPLRNMTGHDLHKMRQEQQRTPFYAYGEADAAKSQPHQSKQQSYGGGAPGAQQMPAEEQNFSKLIERVDQMAATEETKIMTFKSQDNGFMPSQGPPDMHHQQSENQKRFQGNQGQFEPTNTNGTQFDKRGSLNTLSQMTNPFRTGIYNNPANGMTMMSQSEMGQTRGQYAYNNGAGQILQNSESQIMQDDQFSSPEENKTMHQEANHVGLVQNNYRQDTDHDPSSSSMSGYDMKGILSRVRNQANYVQNNVLKNANVESPIHPSDQYGDGPRHQYNGSGLSNPHSDPNTHQFMSQNIPMAGDQTPFTAHALSHVVSQQNPVSARNTAGDAPSSYHPVVSQDFNPLKTTLGKEDEIPQNSSGIKSNRIEEAKQQSHPQALHTNAPGPGHYHVLPQFNIHMQNQNPSQVQVTSSSDKNTPHQASMGISNKYMVANKKSVGSDGDEQQNETTMTDDLSDYSSSAHDLAQSHRHRSQSHQQNQQLAPQAPQPASSQHQSSNQHLMMMPKQLQSTMPSKQEIASSPSMGQPKPQHQNFVNPPAQIHQQESDSQQALEARMQDFINSQKALQAQSQPLLPHQNQSQMTMQQKSQTTPSAAQMHFNPPKGQLKPMTDTEGDSSSDDDDDDDLSSGSGLTGTETSGIDTSSMSQSLQSSVGVQGLIAQGQQPIDPGMISMPKQVKNQYPAMAFNHPKYAGTLQKHQ